MPSSPFRSPPNPRTREHRVSEVDRKLGDVAAAAGIRRVHVLAWRDLDDAEAGGSELHAHQILSRWARAGLDVTMRTSFAADHPAVTRRDGYRVVRRAGRYMVFPRSALAELTGLHGPADGLVEIWNGMPFFSPVWARVPHVVWLHHLHAEMWDMTLPPNLARIGRFVESRLAPPLYRGTTMVTLSESSKVELVDEMGFRSDRVRVVHPGVDASFTPGDVRAAGASRPRRRASGACEALPLADRRARRGQASSPRIGSGDRR